MGKPAPIEIKVAPPGKLLLCLTVRDLFGVALPAMKVTVRQGGRVLADARPTDDKGRLVVPEVETAGKLEIALDPAYVPNDAGVRRPVQYKYLIEQVGAPAQMFVTNGTPVPPQLDVEKAYLTLFARVDPPFTPKFRFPWQNPIHRSEDSGHDAIYANRVRVLRRIVGKFFGVTGADVLDHDALVAKLIELFQAGALPKGTVVPPSPAPSPDLGSAEGGAPPDSVPPPPPPTDAAPANVLRAPLSIKPDEPPPAPSATQAPPPGAAPPPANDPPQLPKWVWYLFFHYAGLRYTPHNPDGSNLHSTGAHGSYVDPSKLLRVLRVSEVAKLFPVEASKGEPAPSLPPKEDVTEMCVLAFALQKKAQADSSLGALLGTNVPKLNGEMRRLFGKVAGDAEKKVTAMTKDGLNGDYFALAFLRARHLKKSFSDIEFKFIVSRTQLRNDVTADDWEIKTQAVPSNAFDQAVREALKDATAWKTRHPTTLDPLSCAGVCNQESEFGDHARGHVPPGGIPANAAAAAPLLTVNFANSSSIHRASHFFYLKYEGPAAEHQMYPNDTIQVDAWFLDPPPKGSNVPSAATDISQLTDVAPPAVQYYDPDSPMNVRLKPPNVVKQTPALPHIFKMPAKDVVGHANHVKFPGNAFLRLNKETTDQFAFKQPHDPAKPKVEQLFEEIEDEKTKKKKKTPKKIDVERLEVLKWSHQEIVIHVNRSSDRAVVSLWSTASDGDIGTGIRTVVVSAPVPFPNILFGAPAAEKPMPDLDGIYLDPAKLRAP